MASSSTRSVMEGDHHNHGGWLCNGQNPISNTLFLVGWSANIQYENLRVGLTTK